VHLGRVQVDQDVLLLRRTGHQRSSARRASFLHTRARHLDVAVQTRALLEEIHPGVERPEHVVAHLAGQLANVFFELLAEPLDVGGEKRIIAGDRLDRGELLAHGQRFEPRALGVLLTLAHGERQLRLEHPELARRGVRVGGEGAARSGACAGRVRSARGDRQRTRPGAGRFGRNGGS
jgi:hypothetical protein